MKVFKNQLEIFVSMSIMFVCLKKQIQACKTWDNVVDVIYTDAKYITFEEFLPLYDHVFKNTYYYLSFYNVDAELVNRGQGKSQDALQVLLEKQHLKD
jgi:hypothetical protein